MKEETVEKERKQDKPSRKTLECTLFSTEDTVRIQRTAAIGKVLRSISIESNVGE